MVRDKTFLVGVDDSDSSSRSVSYLANMVGPREDFHIVLLHVLPSTPLELLEFGEAEDPGTEQQLDASLKKEQAEWIETAKKTAEPIMERAKTILYRMGVSPTRITAVFSSSIHRPDIVRELTETAHKQHCGTNVVGWESYSTYKELFHHHVGAELVRQAPGMAIWVIA